MDLSVPTVATIPIHNYLQLWQTRNDLKTEQAEGAKAVKSG